MQEIGNLKNRLRRWFQNLLQKKKKKEKKEQEENWRRRFQNRFVSFFLTIGTFFLGFFFYRASDSLKSKVKLFQEKVNREEKNLSIEEYQKELVSLQKQVLKKNRKVQEELLPILVKTSSLLLKKEEKKRTSSFKSPILKEEIFENNFQKQPPLEKIVPSFFIKKEVIKPETQQDFKKQEAKQDFKEERKVMETFEKPKVTNVFKRDPFQKKECPVMEKEENLSILSLLKESLYWKEKIKDFKEGDLKDIERHLKQLEEQLKEYNLEEILFCIERFLLPISLEEMIQKKYFFNLYEDIRKKEKTLETKPVVVFVHVNASITPVKKEDKEIEKKKENKKILKKAESKKFKKIVEPIKKIKVKVQENVESTQNKEDTTFKKEVSDYQKSFFYIQQLVNQYSKELTLKQKKMLPPRKINAFVKNTFHFALFFPISILSYFKNPLYGRLTAAFFLNNSIRHVQNITLQKKKKYLSLKKLLSVFHEEENLLWLLYSVYSDALLQLQDLKKQFLLEYFGSLGDDLQSIQQQMNEMEEEIIKRIDSTEMLIHENDYAKQKVLK